MDRKAQVFDTAQKVVFWTIVGIVITGVMFAFVLTIVNYKGKLVQVPSQLQAELIALRFTNVEDCFARHDPQSGTTMSGVIDLQKFTDQQLEKCYPLDLQTGHTRYNFRLLLQEHNTEIKTSSYANRDIFSFNKEVLVSKDGRLLKDQLIVYVQDLKVR